MSQQQQQQRSPLVNVGAAWRRESANGNEYFSLKLEHDIPAGTNLQMFWVQEKTSENAPDLSIAGREDQGFQARQQGQGSNGGGQRQQQQSNRQGNGGGQRQGNNGGGYQGNRNNGGQQRQQQGNGGGGRPARTQGNQGNRPQQNWDSGDDLSADEIQF